MKFAGDVILVSSSSGCAGRPPSVSVPHFRWVRPWKYPSYILAVLQTDSSIYHAVEHIGRACNIWLATTSTRSLRVANANVKRSLTQTHFFCSFCQLLWQFVTYSSTLLCYLFAIVIILYSVGHSAISGLFDVIVLSSLSTLLGTMHHPALGAKHDHMCLILFENWSARIQRLQLNHSKLWFVITPVDLFEITYWSPKFPLAELLKVKNGCKSESILDDCVGRCAWPGSIERISSSQWSKYILSIANARCSAYESECFLQYHFFKW